VILNGRKYSLDELKIPSTNSELTAFEKTTLAFCRAWLTGQQSFAIHTSGSTGTSKEIQLKRSALEASARMTLRALALKPGGNSLVCLDTAYIAGQMMLVRSLLHNMNIVAVEPTANPLKNIDHPVDLVALVPHQLETILEQSPGKLNSVRCALIGGAPVSSSLRKKISKSTCALYATYGMTETVSHIALQQLNGEDAKDYFEALENIHLRVDDRGCLCIQTPYLPAEIITNDLVEMAGHNQFRWLGRIDNVINSGGIKITPEKIELVFENIFDSIEIKNRFFIAGVPHKKWGQQVVLFLEGDLSKTDENTIIKIATGRLRKYELPKKILRIEKFTETATAKIDRKNIVLPYL